MKSRFVALAVISLLCHSPMLQAADRVPCPFMFKDAQEIPEEPCATMLIEDFNKSARVIINRCGGVILAQLEIVGADKKKTLVTALLDSIQNSAFLMAVPSDAAVKFVSQSFMDPYQQVIDGTVSANVEYTEKPEDPFENKNVEIRFRNKSDTPIYVSGRVNHPVQPPGLTQLCTFQKVIGQFDSWSFTIPRKTRSTEVFQLRPALLFEAAK